MAKVRTLSRNFLKGHPRAGEPTYFVEKFYNSLFHKNNLMDYPFGLIVDESIRETKGHTIRMGRHFKPEDELTLAVWSDKPYRSKQIKLWAGPIRAIDIDIIIESHYDELFLSLRPGHIKLEELAKNDGLSLKDFRQWFNLPVGEHAAQILIWNPNIIY